jgi:hypothetical protein
MITVPCEKEESRSKGWKAEDSKHRGSKQRTMAAELRPRVS